MSDRILDYLEATKVGRHHAVPGGELEPSMRVLREWQSERLARTHADLLAHPKYGPACRFFLTDVYAPRDFSQRDNDIMRVYESMQHLLPPPLLRVMEVVIELNAATQALDEALLRVLVDDLGMTDTLDAEMYADAYRRCDNYDERARQIDLIVAVGRGVQALVHKPAVGLALKLARIPARLAGWHEHQDFLERGFRAFKGMKNAEPFLATISERERRILDRIYAGAPDPFDLGHQSRSLPRSGRGM
jgi:hypothetical protein